MHAKKAGTLLQVKMNLWQAVEAINVKLIPKILYTAQVAHYSGATVRQWEDKHREIVRRAADLPLAMPVDLYYKSLVVERFQH